jgi:hypothetical protein
VPDLADLLRKYLTFAPERTLFGTDVIGFPGTPVGMEFVHLALTRHLRESPYLALARLVEDGTFTESEALGVGGPGLSGLHGRARRGDELRDLP